MNGQAVLGRPALRILRPTIFVAPVPDCAMIAAVNSNKFGFCLGTLLSRQRRYIGSKQKLQDAVNDRFAISVASETAEDHNHT